MKLFGPYKKSSRTASMQLSINAIVILVMAMAVLGIGLGLIRGVLGSGKDKLMGSLEAMDLSEPATAEKPLTNINNLKVTRNKENTLGVGFYNAQNTCSGFDQSGAIQYSAYLNMSCSKNGVPVVWDTFDYLPVDVGQGESKTIGAIVKTQAAAGNYACKIEIRCGNDNNGVPIVAESSSAFVQIIA